MSHSRRLLFTLALTTLMSLSFFAASGCAGALMMPYYLIYGTDAPAKYKKVVKDIPKGSTIVVICRSNLNLYGSSSPNADLSQALTYVLSTQMTDVKKKKFVWISYDEVESKFEEEELTSQSFEKLGNALKADYVVGVEIDDFDVHHSTQFYQGKAKVLVRLVDVKHAETVTKDSMPTYVYPPTPIPSSDYDELEFQKTFITRLAKHIGTLFCPHDPHEEYAADSDFPER